MQYPIKYIESELSGFYSQSEAKALSRIILEDAFGLPFADVLACKFNHLSDSEARKIKDIVFRLKNFEPIQYILGTTLFYGMTFLVNENVLIPRPETEELVEWILAETSAKAPKILDIGTGSGCISVAIAKKMPNAEVEAWDISEGALQIASENAERNNVKVRFLLKDVFSEISNHLSLDVIVSNPPYITESEKKEMTKNVLDFEPHSALFVPDNNPLMFYERIADIAAQQLCDGGKLFFEINRAMGDEIVKMLSRKGFSEIALREDLSGNRRMVRAFKL